MRVDLLDIKPIIATIVYITVSIVVGLFLFEKLDESRADQLSVYQSAIKIKDVDTMDYAMDTNSGNSLVEGEIKSIGSVKFPEMNKKFFAVERVKERYTRHTRTVKSGKSTRTQVYYTWDYVSSSEKSVDEIIVYDKQLKLPKNTNINGMQSISASKITNAHGQYYKVTPTVRYKYKVIPKSFDGVLATKLKQDGIGNMSKRLPTALYVNQSNKSVLTELENNHIVRFWIIWTIVSIIIYAAIIYLNGGDY